jgi:hypothetical protein
MLTEADRTIGHRLAGDWLETAGEQDALTLADHFERGGERHRAVSWLVRAAQRAFAGGNLDAAFALAQRGVESGATGNERGLLRSVQVSVRGVRGDWAGAVELGLEAKDLIPVDSNEWILLIGTLFFAGMTSGDPSVTASMMQTLLNPSVQPQPSGPWGACRWARSRSRVRS